MLNLRPHQERGIADLRAALTRHQSVMFRAETGYGKTVIASHIASRVSDAGKRLWFICHRRELVEQTVLTFEKAGINTGIIMAGQEYNPFPNVHVVSIDSLSRRWDKVTIPHYAIIDECHHSLSESWQNTIAILKKAGVKIIGLTATPWRANGAGFRGVFDDLVETVDTAWLIENGYLSRFRVFCPSTPDLKGAHIQGGDYKTADLEKIMGKADLMGCAVSNWKEKAESLRTIAFAPSISMSESMAATFRANGVNAAHLDGGTDKKDRRQVIRDFADGKIHVLWNVNLFSEGFDLSAIAGRDVPIECLIQYRPTQSLAMHRQQVGRALRPKQNPAIILDHAGNHARHGFQDDHIFWSLDGMPKRPKEEVAESFRLCPSCLESHRPRPSCPACGYVYPVAVKEFTVIDGVLSEVLRGEQTRPTRDQVSEIISRCTTYKQLCEVEKKLGYKHGWAWHIAQGKDFIDAPKSKYDYRSRAIDKKYPNADFYERQLNEK